MTPPLLIINAGKASGYDEALAALADFLGIEARFSHFDEAVVKEGRAGSAVSASAVSGETIVRLAAAGRLRQFRRFVGDRLSSLLVYGLEPSQPITEALDLLTGGQVYGVHPTSRSAQGYQVHRNGKGICRQLAGLSIGAAEGADDCCLDVAGGTAGVEALVSIGAEPFFCTCRVGGCTLFITGGRAIADIRQPLAEHLDSRRFFSGLVPPAMYIKHAFGDAAWHSEKDRACLIVDDPLLRESYGFLNYRTLASLMDCFDFSTSIGFIPWNFRRTARETALLLNARADHFSLCVHGCDHTRGEFGSSSERELARMIRTATDRMIRHSGLTGLAFDRVMVFPQGVFSTHAMRVLKSSNYLAAVNSEAFPVDPDGPLRVRDFLEPAIVAFEGFPLFLRRWPDDVEGLAWDLFWGRPALVLAHHDFFKGGCRRVIELMSRVGSLNADIEWAGLGNIVKRSHLVKMESDGTTRVRSYCTEMVIRNDSSFERKLLITAPSPGSPVRVLSGGNELSHELSDEGLTVPVCLAPHRQKVLNIVHPRSEPEHFHLQTWGKAIRIRMRRYLSEVRDNYISRNSALLSIATRLKDRLLA